MLLSQMGKFGHAAGETPAGHCRAGTAAGTPGRARGTPSVGSMLLSQLGKFGHAAGETPAGHCWAGTAAGTPVRGTPRVGSILVSQNGKLGHAAGETPAGHCGAVEAKASKAETKALENQLRNSLFFMVDYISAKNYSLF